MGISSWATPAQTSQGRGKEGGAHQGGLYTFSNTLQDRKEMRSEGWKQGTR